MFKALETWVSLKCLSDRGFFRARLSNLVAHFAEMTKESVCLNINTRLRPLKLAGAQASMDRNCEYSNRLFIMQPLGGRVADLPDLPASSIM